MKLMRTDPSFLDLRANRDNPYSPLLTTDRGPDENTICGPTTNRYHEPTNY